MLHVAEHIVLAPLQQNNSMVLAIFNVSQISKKKPFGRYAEINTPDQTMSKTAAMLW